MAKFQWSEVTREDVISAIGVFVAENPTYPEPRSTFLIFEGKRYPAKHIRGMAYKAHFGREISKQDYSGGLETVRFFERLGFKMRYQHQCVDTHPSKKVPSNSPRKADEQKTGHSTEAATLTANYKTDFSVDKISIPTKGVIEQKNALQLLLNRMFAGDIVCEKTYPWMRTPTEIVDEYIPLVASLSDYRGHKNFVKKNVALRCDFVCESQKLIIEYDERQHFSEARRISLLAYSDIPTNFDRQMWIRACQSIQAKDNQPVDRDEVRAFYDSTRDIEAAKHGYRLVRIMHGQIDFEAIDAPQKLAALLGVENYKHKDTEIHSPSELQSEMGQPSSRQPIKIGLYLQTNELFGDKNAFEKAMEIIRTSDIDILVFPEFSYVPFVEEFHEADFLLNDDVQNLYDRTLELSRSIGRAVVISNEDKYGTIMCIYANNQAEDGETRCKDYIKHTMTNFSACEIANYHEYADEVFQPVIYHGFRIGLTICYDCNHSIFSRKYGLNGVDMILNCTGGNVVYDKWFKYNKVRAIENRCFAFVTMAGDGTQSNPHNFVYGFTPTGKEMKPTLLNGTSTGRRNVSGGIYVYNTADDDGTTEPDSSINQTETTNKMSDLFIPANDVASLIYSGIRLVDGIHILQHGGLNIVLCLVDSDDIMKPEKVLKLLYAEELKGLANKRYVIVNRWDNVDLDFYNTTLSVVLKVRSMENYCAVVLTSSNLTKCFQCGQNRTAQVVKAENGQFGIDLRRTGGPETIWRDKDGMKACWRDNIEWLIGTM